MENLYRHPKIKFVIHNSGSLLEWIEKKHPEYFEKLNEIVARSQCELLGGGYYEPLLTLIPKGDRIDQIRAFSDYLYEKFNVTPKGIWLTERVWEPNLIDTLIDAGIHYTIVDDTHFLYAGLCDRALDGYYLSENEGRTLKIFPGSMKLRYLVPFRPVSEIEDYLKSIDVKSFRVLADDGEKFGIWPGTFEHVYTSGWLEEFLVRLEFANIKTMTFAEALLHFEPKGRIYLPCASYEEMGEWVLDPELYEKLKNLKNRCTVEDKNFIQGGYFKNFLVKYPEANQMHKRMLYVSQRINENHQARRELWQGQASCAYWHGIFGGLYLPHLREAIYQHLIAADNIGVHAAGFEQFDFDCDGEEEIVFSNQYFFIVFKQRYGAVMELDLRPCLINLINVMSRRLENYHFKLAEPVKTEGIAVKSIHEQVTVKEKALDKYLSYDPLPRYLFTDFCDNEIQSYQQSVIKDNSIQFTNSQMLKAIRVHDNNIDLSYEPSGPARPITIELNLGLFESNIEFAGKIFTKQESGSMKASSFTLVNHDKKFNLCFTSPEQFRIEYRPIETVSMSEGGIEKNYQGTALRFHFAVPPSLNIEVICS